MLEISSTNKIIGNTYSVVVPGIYEQFKIDRDAEVFETVALDYLLTKHADDQELIEYIMSLPKSDKRMATLLAIDGDNVLWSKMNSFVNGCVDKFEHIKDVVKIINQFVKDGEVERKKYGEVMTPITLVREMLDTLPKDVWSNPNLKWLDPANGAGTFPFVVIYKLMNGLKDWQPDVELRYKHIVENMIYTCELQSRNVALWLCGVDPKDEYTTNTYWGSFLDEGFDYHMKNVWGVDKFDIVIGNPPYQEHKEGFTKTKPLWNLFVDKSLSIMEKGGFLNMVHPGGWRSPKGIFRNIYTSFISKNLIFLSINDFKKGLETFGVGTNYDFYCLQNINTDKNLTKVVSTDGRIHELDINKFEFIPNGDFEGYINLIAKENQEKVNILYSRSAYGTDKNNMSRLEIDDFIYPCVYTITQREGINLFFSKTINNGHFNIPKVIWSNGLGTYPIVDNIGQYGLTQFSYGIVDELENLENIKKSLESDKFLKLMEYSKFTNNKYDYKVISTFKKDFWKDFV